MSAHLHEVFYMENGLASEYVYLLLLLYNKECAHGCALLLITCVICAEKNAVHCNDVYYNLLYTKSPCIIKIKKSIVMSESYKQTSSLVLFL